MNNNTVVIDASVIFQFFIAKEELYHFQATKIKNDYLKNRKIDIIVPSFWVYEIGNIVKFRIANPNDQDEYWEKFLLLNFSEQLMTAHDHLQILKLARVNNATYYDTAYHYTALKNNCKLITADEKFIKKVDSKNIMHIKDYQ